MISFDLNIWFVVSMLSFRGTGGSERKVGKFSWAERGQEAPLILSATDLLPGGLFSRQLLRLDPRCRDSAHVVGTLP